MFRYVLFIFQNENMLRGLLAVQRFFTLAKPVSNSVLLVVNRPQIEISARGVKNSTYENISHRRTIQENLNSM